MTRKFTTAVAKTNQWFLSWARVIHSVLPHPISPRTTSILSTHIRPGLPSRLFPSGFPTNIAHAFLFAICATSPANFTLLDLLYYIILFYIILYYIIDSPCNARCIVYEKRQDNLKSQRDPNHAPTEHKQVLRISFSTDKLRVSLRLRMLLYTCTTGESFHKAISVKTCFRWK
jgi:hypothetical protein